MSAADDIVVHLARRDTTHLVRDGRLLCGIPARTAYRVTIGADDPLAAVTCRTCRRKALGTAPRRTPVNEIVHKAQCRETGATITVERTGPGSWVEQEPGWMTLCLNHAAVCMHDTYTLALHHAAYPSLWCEDCDRIAEGNAPRIVEPVE